MPESSRHKAKFILVYAQKDLCNSKFYMRSVERKEGEMKKLLCMILVLIFAGLIYGGGRSNQWHKVRAAYLKAHPACAVCGSTEKLEVHHIKPFSQNPELELDPNNLITLCEGKKYGVNCHLFFGHLGNYKKFNPNVRQDANEWNLKLNQK